MRYQASHGSAWAAIDDKSTARCSRRRRSTSEKRVSLPRARATRPPVAARALCLGFASIPDSASSSVSSEFPRASAASARTQADSAGRDFQALHPSTKTAARMLAKARRDAKTGTEPDEIRCPGEARIPSETLTKSALAGTCMLKSKNE